jgi:hypothetical protein
MAVVAAELGGPFRDFRLTRDEGFFMTKLAFTGVVDLTSGLAGLSDPDLQAKLGDAPLALDPDSVRDKVQVLVDVRLPREHRTWRPAMGEQTAMALRSETFNLVPLVPTAIAAGLALAALVLALTRARRT